MLHSMGAASFCITPPRHYAVYYLTLSRWDFNYFLNLRGSCWVEVTAQFWFQLTVFGREAQTSVVSQNQLWDGTEKLNRRLPSIMCPSEEIIPQILNHNSFSLCYLGNMNIVAPAYLEGAGCYTEITLSFPFSEIDQDLWKISYCFLVITNIIL